MTDVYKIVSEAPNDEVTAFAADAVRAAMERGASFTAIMRMATSGTDEWVSDEIQAHLTDDVVDAIAA